MRKTATAYDFVVFGVMFMRITVRKLNNRIKKITKLGVSLALIAVMLLSTALSLNLSLTANAAGSNSQTKYANVSEFQKDRWKAIQSEIFGQNFSSVQQGTKIATKCTVKDDNKYFNWVDTGLTKWDGTVGTGYKSEVVNLNFNSPGSNSSKYKFNFTQYNITNAKQFRGILENLMDGTSDTRYIKINLTKDLDMGGQIDTIWDPIECSYGLKANNSNNPYDKYVYIEGNGHTIYNLKIYTKDKDKGAGLFSHPPAFLNVKNLGFQSVMVINGYNVADTNDPNGIYNFACAAGALSAFCPQKGYLYNVHVNDGYYQISDKVNNSASGGIGGLIGRKDIWGSMNGFSELGRRAFERGDTGDFFIKNCSTSGLYMYGADHIGGLTSYMGLMSKSQHTYKMAFPDYPEQYILPYVNYAQYVNTAGTDYDACTELKNKNNYFPIMVQDCYSVDCTIFSTGHDSGAFISCGRGIVARNCFTNNTIYATDNTGGFIGRCVNTNLPCIKDARGTEGKMEPSYCTIGSYFEKCYSSGIVEGSMAMGGFVGLDNTRRYVNHIFSDESYTNSFGERISPKTAEQMATYPCTVYRNCYSTAMVGMDYAGKYCGGFVGLDDNYSTLQPRIFLTDTDQANNKKTKIPAGSVYINCYAAGEVGNILTVTDSSIDTISLEENYFYKHEKHDTQGQTLNYYPTGGFAGAVGIDMYNYKYYDTPEEYEDDKIKVRDLNGGKIGYFHNCYYDMQTTAMHEMAVGLSKLQTCNHKDGIPYYSIPGVKGLYTVDSNVKKIPGLTGSPVTLGGIKFQMDEKSSNSTVWQYNHEYYPQIEEFMKSDTTLSDIKTATSNDVTKGNIASSNFLVADTDVNEGRESHPVLSMANTKWKKDNKNTYAAQLASVVAAYRYSQASTSTVLLNHWDYTMNTKSGWTEGENNWVPGLPQNKMVKKTVKDEDGKDIEEWQIEYTNVAAGSYEFKVQAGTSFAFNYGRTMFNDTENIKLEVPFDRCTVRIRFHYKELKGKDFYVKADYINPDDGKVTTSTLTAATGVDYIPVPYTVAGNLPEEIWNANENSHYTMKYMGDEKTYSLTIKNLPADDYLFKITDGGGWGINYGINGTFDGGNMSFICTDTTDVTIVFDQETKLCTVTASDPDKITKVYTSDKVFDFKGFSLICSSPEITGYIWLPTGQEEAAANAGKLIYNKSTKNYSQTFNLKIKDEEGNLKNVDTNYAYKVIEDAIDNGGQNSGFYVAAPLDPAIDEIPITFTYNAVTGKTTVTSSINDVVQPYVKATTYSVIGTYELTGYDWMGLGRGDEYSIDAAKSGEMRPVAGTDKYEIIYNNIRPGTYQFKVVPDTLDGMWSFPLDYGDGNGGNFTFTILDEVDGVAVNDATVVITFDKERGRIDVSTTPKKALKLDRYVLAGTVDLMGEAIGKWNFHGAEMQYDDETGHYLYTLDHVNVNDAPSVPTATYLPNINYAFKVVPYDVDRGENQILVVRGSQEFYKLTFDYNPATDTTEVFAYDENGDDVSDDVLSFEITPTFYSVIGDRRLTGYDWDISQSIEAAYNGLMTDDNLDGIYEKTYKIEVPTNGSSADYAFKVVANGTFNSGLSWGPEGQNDNDNVIVFVSSNDPSITSANLTIIFDSNTGEISYSLDPEEVNDTSPGGEMQWYVAGTYMLRSNNNFTYDTKVYDTVRDITSGFTFTCGQRTKERGLTWMVDKEYNEASLFKDRLSYGIHYTQGMQETTPQEISAYFTKNIVDLVVQPVYEKNFNTAGAEDDIKILAQYYVEKCMPGKQWLKVTSAGYGYSSTFREWKKNYLAYNDYLTIKSEYDKCFDRYFAILKGTAYPDSVAGYVTEYNMLDYLVSNPGVCDDVATRIGLKDKTLVSIYNEMTNTTKYPVTEKPVDQYPSVENQSIVGARNIRLIPTSYLEAGNNAKINVVQSEGDATGETATNIVRYDATNSDSDTQVWLTGSTETTIDKIPFSYYNVGMTASYISTDKVGLGIYNNYNSQTVEKYDQKQVRNEDDVNVRNDNNGKGRYFAMSSAFNNNEIATGSTGQNGVKAYTDMNGKNIRIGEFINQSIIGNSRFKNESTKGQTMIKMFKRVLNGNGDEILDLVYTDNNQDAETEYTNNYKMWAGEKKFTAAQAGEYTAMFYWVLSDGRYLSDSKDISVTVLEPGLSKTVDTLYDTAGDNRELTYNVTYTNDKANENLNFAILDVLPFDNSTRTHTDSKGNTRTEVTSDKNKNVKFNIESLSISYSNPSTVIKGIYYSPGNDPNIKSVREFTSLDPTSNTAAEQLALSTSESLSENGKITGEALKYFKEIGKNYDPAYGVTDTASYYSPGDRYKKYSDVTALAITGIELGIGESITLSFKVKYNGDYGDYLVNDAHFYVQGVKTSDIHSSDNCNPVSTALIDRSLSGYAWLDRNADGLVDDGEERLQGLTARLYLKHDSGVTDTGITAITNSEGLYRFDSIPAGDYVIKFTEGDNAGFKYSHKDELGQVRDVYFKELSASPTKIQTEMNGNITGSRNLFSPDYIEVDEKTQLNECSLDLTIPTNQQIYHGSYSNREKLNSQIEPYYYHKKLQNAGFFYETYENTVEIQKTSKLLGITRGISGVDFMLEYKVVTDETDEDGNVTGATESWYPVYYVEETNDLGKKEMKPVFNFANPKTAEELDDLGISYIKTTDEDGFVKFEKLFSGDFRFTEVDLKDPTAQGYGKVEGLGKLMTSVEFKLPYTVDMDKLSEYSQKKAVQLSDDESDYLLSEDGKTRFYRKVTFEVRNNPAQFDLPLTGTVGAETTVAIIAIVILGTAIVFIFLSRKKSRKPKQG